MTNRPPQMPEHQTADRQGRVTKRMRGGSARRTRLRGHAAPGTDVHAQVASNRCVFCGEDVAASMESICEGCRFDDGEDACDPWYLGAWMARVA